MTKVKISIFFFLLTVCITGSILVMNSCKKACSSVYCYSGVVNSDCLCICNTGFEGIDCSTEMRAKFLGNYTYSETCNPSGANSYVITIDTSFSAMNKIKIFNVYNSGLTVIATVSGTTLSIASQAFLNPFTISGSGSISSNTLSLTYKITDGTITDNCSGTGTK